MNNLKVLVFLIALVSAHAAFSAEILTSKDGTACTVLDDGRLHCWNMNSAVETKKAVKKITFIKKEATFKLENRLPRRRLITLADL